MGGTVSMVEVRVLVNNLATAGIDRDALLAAVGLPAALLADDDARVGVAIEVALWDEASQRSGDPDFGLRLARRLPLGTWGALEYALHSSATLGDALDRMLRYQRVLNDGFTIDVISEGDRAVIRCIPDGVAHPRHMAETWAAALALRARLALGGANLFDEIRFPHPQPDSIAEHRRVFGAPLRFGCDWTALVFRRELLERRMPTADPALCRILDHHLAAQLSHLAPRRDVVADARVVLGHLLAGGEPTLDTVARRLGMHARTLQRRLRDGGASFQRLVDDLRRERALAYLARGDVALCEIAFLLGFAEASAFHRAFRRWTGATPAEYRARTS